MDTRKSFEIYPILHKDIWQMYVGVRAATWFSSNIKFDKDIEQWSHESESIRNYMKKFMTFFAVSESIVLDNIEFSYSSNPLIPVESKIYYDHQKFMEREHSITYWDTIYNLVSNEFDREKLIEAAQTSPSIANKAAWARKWMIAPKDDVLDRAFAGALSELKEDGADTPLDDAELLTFVKATLKKREELERLELARNTILTLCAFVCVEGVGFSASFAGIQWLRTLGKYPGVCDINEYVSRDEGNHVKHGALLLRKLRAQYPDAVSDDELYAMMAEFVELEIQFADESLPEPLPRMNATLMRDHIRSVADTSLVLMGLKRTHNVETPFEFMKNINLHIQSNFFEVDGTNYVMTGNPVASRGTTADGAKQTKLMQLDDY